MASAAALNSPKVGSFIPDCDWGKYAIEYARLGPRKVLPGAQQSFVNLIIAETTGINTTRRTKPRGIAAWADECNCEERQMASIMNDALERGLVYSFPELARGTDGKIDVAKKPKKLEFYMPAPAAWREIADLPKRPKLLKMPDPELTEEEAGDDETRNTLRDSVKLPRLSLPRKRTVKQDLPLATNELSYRNDSGLDLDVLAVVRPSGACVLRIALPAETRNTLRDSDPAARTDNHSEKSNGLQHRPADETRNGLRVSGSAARNDGAHRDELRLALNAKLRDPARFPDDALDRKSVV